MTGEILASSAFAPPAMILLQSCDLKRPVGPAHLSQRSTWRSSSEVRRPEKNRQYHWNQPYLFKKGREGEEGREQMEEDVIQCMLALGQVKAVLGDGIC